MILFVVKDCVSDKMWVRKTHPFRYVSQKVDFPFNIYFNLKSDILAK